MGATLDADINALGALQERLEDIASGGLSDLYEVLAETGRTLVIEQFERQGDAYGKAWEPRNEAFGRRSGGQILRDSGRFQNSFVARPTGDGFEVGSNFIGARVLTQGATILPKNGPFLAVPLRGGGIARLKKVTIPARGVIPTGEAGPLWGPRLIEQIEDYGAEVLGAK